MESVIVVNPDRFSRQSFPPFILLCKALLDADYKVKCLGAKRHNLIPVTANFEFLTPFKPGPRPILYGVRFILFAFFKVIQLSISEKCSEIAVFRSCDSLAHCLSSRILNLKLVFFVDYLPWQQGMGIVDIIKNPQMFLQVLGLCVAKKIIVSSNYLAQEITKNLPFLAKKVFVEQYSAEHYKETIINESRDKREEILKRFAVDTGFIILAGAPYVEISIRAAACIDNAILILQVASSDTNQVMGLARGLGMIDRLELVGLESDLLELIPLMDALVIGGSGVYILTALSADVPVFAQDSLEIREWIASDRFLFKSKSVQSLIELLSEAAKSSKWSLEGVEQCQAHFKRDSQSWGLRAISHLKH